MAELKKLVRGVSTAGDVFDNVNGLIDLTDLYKSGQPTSVALGLIDGNAQPINAQISNAYKDKYGNTYAFEASLNTVDNPYSYVAFKVSGIPSDFIGQVFRVFIESDKQAPINIFASNGNAWGSSENVVEAFISQTLNAHGDIGYIGYIDIDLTPQKIADFYADPKRANDQNLYFLIGLRGGFIVDDLNLKVSFVNLGEFESATSKLINTNSSLLHPADTISFEFKKLASQVESLKTTALKNAGIQYIPNEKVYEKLNTGMEIFGSVGDGGVTVIKEPELDGNYAWYGVKIAIEYKSLEDLNTLFYTGFKHISGELGSAFNIVNGADRDWNPNNSPVHIAGSVDTPINIYELIMQSPTDVIETYQSQNELYINIAFFNPDGEYTASRSSEWFLNPYFKIKNATVIATELDEKLQESLSSEIEDIASGGGAKHNYLIGWGDSLTAGGGWTNTIANLSGFPFYNAGTGGENCRTIMARQGADAMIVNNITIPSNPVDILIADRDIDGGIATEMGHLATPLLQGGSHINPVTIGNVEGVLTFTGASYSDMTGNWVFRRSEIGGEVVINRPTQIRTNYDKKYNGSGIAIIFIGQNGGYSGIDDLVWQNKKMIEQSRTDKYIVLGLSSGSAIERNEYEAAMVHEFGRRFISLRQYLAAPIHNDQGDIINCYGLDDADLTATQSDIDAIAEGKVPPQCLSDSVHYTSKTKTVIGEMVYKKMKELNFFE